MGIAIRIPDNINLDAEKLVIGDRAEAVYKLNQAWDELKSWSESLGLTITDMNQFGELLENELTRLEQIHGVSISSNKIFVQIGEEEREIALADLSNIETLPDSVKNQLKGADGATGPKGNDGAVGPKGNDGNDGAVGPKGNNGNDGAVGSKGNDGATGLKGDTGASGSSVEWDSGWFAISSNKTITKSHNIGTQPLKPSLLLHIGGKIVVGNIEAMYANGNLNGTAIIDINASTVTVRSGVEGVYFDPQRNSFNTGYARIIL